jgi:D-alanyl-D-alanine endopeptidase (penicillin-binding protein 7)
MGWLLLNALLATLLAGFGGQPYFTKEFPRLALPAAVAHAAEAPQPSAVPAPPVKVVPESLGVELTASSAALVDVRSGSILFSKGADRIVPIASITKLMTAIVVLDAGPDWDAVLTITPADDRYEGLPYLKVGETMTVREAFDAALAGSLNNGALALARSTGLDDAAFAARMNAKARELGMSHSRFADPSGYLPENVSTVEDLARLGLHAFGRPEIREALTRKAYSFRTAQGIAKNIPATNALLGGFLNEGDSRIVGGKTGYTEEAGYTLVMQAQNGPGEVIAVVLGSPTTEDRFQDVKSLVAWGFRTFRW